MIKTDELIFTDESQEKRVELFSAPKTVVRKSRRDVIFAQGLFCGIILAGLLLLKAFLPEVYENLAAVFGKYIL